MKTFVEFLIEKYLVNENKTISNMISVLTTPNNVRKKPKDMTPDERAAYYKEKNRKKYLSLTPEKLAMYRERDRERRKAKLTPEKKEQRKAAALIARQNKVISPEEKEARNAARRARLAALSPDEKQKLAYSRYEYSMKKRHLGHEVNRLKTEVEQGTISDEDLNDLRNLVISKQPKI